MRVVYTVDEQAVTPADLFHLLCFGFNSQLEACSSYVDLGATAFDNLDGDVTAMIVTGGLPIDTSIIGTQTITYDVTDSSGNAAKTKKRYVQVEQRCFVFRFVSFRFVPALSLHKRYRRKALGALLDM